MSDGFTSFPNWLIDDVMPMVSSSEWLVVCAVIRQTVGWNKKTDSISYSQFKELTGIKHGRTLNEAIESLLKRGILARIHKGKQSFTYSINEPIQYQTSSENELVQKMHQFRNGTGTGSENAPEPVQKMNTQYIKDKKHNTYIHPDPEPIAAIKTALSKTTKTPLWTESEESYDKAAYMIFGWECSGDDVEAFGKWWQIAPNGHYPGKPALKSLVTEFPNFLTQRQAKQNGHTPIPDDGLAALMAKMEYDNAD